MLCVAEVAVETSWIYQLSYLCLLSLLLAGTTGISAKSNVATGRTTSMPGNEFALGFGKGSENHKQRHWGIWKGGGAQKGTQKNIWYLPSFLRNLRSRYNPSFVECCSGRTDNSVGVYLVTKQHRRAFWHWGHQHIKVSQQWPIQRKTSAIYNKSESIFKRTHWKRMIDVNSKLRKWVF